jgi:3-deoxy-D-manno-octulosonic acid (KDO) 8-phosphate synthase
MSILLRSATSILALATFAVAAAGYYTEAHHAPDQP